MRQLDLFGSFFETNPGNEPVEEPVVSKKEETQPGDVRRPSYSKNLLRSEISPQGFGIDKNEGPSVSLDQTAETILASTLSTLRSLPSLFDTHAAPANEIAVGSVDLPVKMVEEDQPVADQMEQTLVVGSFETIVSTDVKSTTDTDDVSSTRAKDEFEISIEEPISAPLPGEKNKLAAAKTKNQPLPELQGSGTVIFDDGKITVKIKNKSPFPPPIVKNKKEKVKKVPQKRGRKSFKEIDAEVDLIEIPEDEILFKKQYYPISEVAKWFRVNTSLLRFWENEFDVLKPRKNRKGDRLFRPEDVKNLQLIYQLLRQKKYTIEGAKEYIKTNKRKADIQLHLTNTLQKFKSFLLDMKANLQP